MYLLCMDSPCFLHHMLIYILELSNNYYLINGPTLLLTCEIGSV